MATGAPILDGIEPAIWYLVFRTKTDRRWLRLLARGRYQHVTAYGYVPAFSCWLFYDVRLMRTSIGVMPTGPEADRIIDELREDADVLAIAPPAVGAPRWARVGMWCVPALSHLVGAGRWTFRPDTFFRACLDAGALMCGEPNA